MTWIEVAETVQKFWLQFVLGALAGAATAAIARMRKLLHWRKAVNASIVAILHDRLFAECIRLLDAGIATEDEIENLEIMFQSYAELGGNGTIKRLMERVRKYVKFVESAPREGKEGTYD